MAKIETYAELERIAKTARILKGNYEVRCLDLPITRRYTLDQAIAAAHDFQKQVDARVTVHKIER